MLHHNGFSTIAIAPKWNDDSTGGLISWEEIVIEVDASVLALANVLLLVKNESEVACNGAFVNQTQISLLDNGARTETVADHLQHKETTFAVELWELKGLCVSQVARLVTIVEFLFMLGNKPIEIDVRGKVGHILAEVVIGINLKHLNLHLLNVLYVHI